MHNYSSVGVLGATGYTGRELVALLERHPRVRVCVATSQGEAGGELPAWSGAPVRLVAVEEAELGSCDLVFSCLPHGESARWVARARELGVAAIDLSADLRLSPEAVYGLTELSRERLRGSALVANPGCYPTAALLSLAPLLRRGLVAGAVVINAASGVTGAGRSPKRDLLFAEVDGDYRAYGVGNTHRHLEEMRAFGGELSGWAPELVFTPHLLPVRRGILETIYVPLTDRLEEREARALWLEDYADEPFVRVLESGVPSLRDVVGTNRVAIGVSAVANASSPALQLVVAIDNLLKGAAGQAVQNMNLMSGWPETEGLPC